MGAYLRITNLKTWDPKIGPCAIPCCFSSTISSRSFYLCCTQLAMMRSLLGFCGGTDPFDFESPCIRGTWSALIPFFLVVVYIISYIPLSQPVRRVKDWATSPFASFVSIADAEAYLYEDATSEDVVRVDEDEEAKVKRRVNQASVKVTLVLSWFGVLETVAWMGIGSFKLAEVDAGSGVPWDAWTSVFIALSWAYAAAKPMLKPQATPSYDLFAFYVLQLVLGGLRLGGEFYDWNVYQLPLPSTLTVVANVLNLVVIMALLAVVLSLPVNVPSKYVDPNEIVSLKYNEPPQTDKRLTLYWLFSGKDGDARRLHDAMGLDHIFVGQAAHAKGMCSHL